MFARFPPCLDVVDLDPDGLLVLLDLDLDLGELVALLRHLVHRVLTNEKRVLTDLTNQHYLLLLPQAEQRGLVLDVALLQVLPHLHDLRLPFLVELDLRRSSHT